MNLNTIFFIGPQGSGKGTQAKLLAKTLGFFYWEMGGILREVAKEDSELGRDVKNLIDQGILLEDELLLRVVKSRLTQISPDQGVVFDGIPRRLGQAEFLLDFLKNQGRKDLATLFVNIPREESITRLLQRAKIENRQDDTLEAIETRLKYYEHETLPVVEFLKQHTQFFEIDGLPPIEEVTNIIKQTVEV